MTGSPSAPVASTGLARALAAFCGTQALLILGLAWALSTFVWTDAASAGAIRASAWLAFGVQAITFAIAKLVVRQNVMAGWGLGVIIRLASVAVWAFLGTKALGLPTGPALLSLVTFYFVSTLVEPLFLNR